MRSSYVIAVLGILTLSTVSEGVSRCLAYLAASVFPAFQEVAPGFRQPILYREETLLFGAGKGIFVWQENDRLFVASKAGLLLANETLPFQAQSFAIIPHFAATHSHAEDLPMHLIGVVTANRMVVYQFDPSLAFDLRLEALDFLEPGYCPRRIESRMTAVEGLPVEIPEFELFDDDGQQTKVHLRGNRLHVVPNRKLKP
jgi:hypothetical protein